MLYEQIDSEQSYPICSSLPWEITFSQYFLSHVCLALEKLGLFEELTRRPLSNEELAQRLHVNDKLLGVLLEFVWSVTDVLERDENRRYAVKNKKYLEVFLTPQAYDEVFNSLIPLLRGEMKYGQDIVRNSLYLQRASALTTDHAITTLLDLLRGQEGQLIDLGCGDCRSLIAYCKNGVDRIGLGVEVDPIIVRQGLENIASAGLSKSIKIKEANIAEVDVWAEDLNLGKKYFLASGVLHELLRDGVEPVVYLLKRVRYIAPAARLFIVEFNALDFDSVKQTKDYSRKLFAASYQLWHPLTNQGMPLSRSQWETLIKDAGWDVARVMPIKHNFLIYDCQ